MCNCMIATRPDGEIHTFMDSTRAGGPVPLADAAWKRCEHILTPAVYNHFSPLASFFAGNGKHLRGGPDSMNGVCFPHNQGLNIFDCSAVQLSAALGCNFNGCMWNSATAHVASIKYHQQLCSATKKYICKMRSATLLGDS